MQAAEAIAAQLARHGITRLFGVLGDGNLPVIDALVHHQGVDYVATAREDGAVLMADGYARASGELGAATVTHGPGLTNTVTALTEAARARTSLVLIAADTPTGSRDNPQDIEQWEVVRPTGAALCQVSSAASAAADVTRAVRHARTQRLPVVLNVPTPLLDEPVGEQLPEPWRPPETAPLEPAPETVGTVADALTAARRPIVLAGRGAVDAGAGPALAALADRVGGLLATTLRAKGLFAGHPRNIGIFGGFSTTLARELIWGSDLVLAAGASINPFTTDLGRLLEHRPTIVHSDLSPAAFGAWTPVDVTAAGDVRVLAERVGQKLDQRGAQERGWHPPDIASRLAQACYADEFTDGSDGTGLDLHAVVAVAEQALPRERTVVVDGGHAPLSEPSRGLSVPDPASFVFPVHFGSIGFGLMAAVGAATARPGRVTVAIVGDGGLMMALAELDTAVRRRLPLAVLVMNDGAYGYEYHNMRHRGIDVGLSLTERPDFAALARAMGATGVTVRTRAGLDGLGAYLTEPQGPVLADIHLTRALRTRWFAEHENGLDPRDQSFRHRYPDETSLRSRS